MELRYGTGLIGLVRGVREKKIDTTLFVEKRGKSLKIGENTKG